MAEPAFDLQHLRAFNSLVLARTRAGAAASLSSVVAAIEEGLANDNDRNVTLGAVPKPWNNNGLRAQFIAYSEEREPAWLSTSPLRDFVHNLVIVFYTGSLWAFLCTDPRDRRWLVQQLRPGGDLVALEPIPPGLLNEAFVAQSSPTALWLAGVHGRSILRPDSKVLTGFDLRYVLDPLADQSFTFTSVRVKAPGRSLGVSPDSGRVWTARTPSWVALADQVRALLDKLAGSTKETAAPLPFLASPATDLTGVDHPYDVALGLPPEDDPTPEDVEIRELAENVVFTITDVKGAAFTASAALGGDLLGELTIVPTVAAIQVSGTPAGNHVAEPFRVLLEAAGRRRLLKAWYESGHTLANGRVFDIAYRDFPFEGFRWENFDGFDVEREKPRAGDVDRPDLTGNPGDNSLFSWVLNRFKQGWLACDDGSMEIADFIHLTEDPSPTLSLIHVKGAHSSSATRELSVAAYEIVVSQAVKNVRYLDRQLIATGVSTGLDKKVGSLVWQDGARVTAKRPRDSFLKKLRTFGANATTQVFVVQPSATRSAYTAPSASAQSRKNQLDALLNSAAAAFRSRGVAFSVIADAGSGAPPPRRRRRSSKAP